MNLLTFLHAGFFSASARAALLAGTVPADPDQWQTRDTGVGHRFLGKTIKTVAPGWGAQSVVTISRLLR